MKETNLEMVKKMAITFLHLDLDVNNVFSFIIHHPFFSSPFYLLFDENGESYIANILNDEESLKRAIEDVENRINAFDNAFSLFHMVNKPYAGTFFKYTLAHLNDDDFSKILKYIWVNTEFPHKDVNVSVKEWHSYFKKTHPEFLMTPEEREILTNFSDTIIVYRGAKDYPLSKALSWSTSKKVATFFANRFDIDGIVYKAKIKKKHIIAYFDTVEKEVILDYNKLFDIEKL